MLTRRRFVAASAMTLAAGPALAQELVSAESPLIEDPGPLRLDIGPAAVDASLTLPPTVEGDYAIPDRYQAKVVQVAPGLVPNDIHIVPASYHLYFILPGDYAIRYGVAVGQAGLARAGLRGPQGGVALVAPDRRHDRPPSGALCQVRRRDAGRPGQPAGGA